MTIVHRPQRSPILDVMIARAEAACERGRKRLDVYRGPPALKRRARQETMEDTLARLRAQREAAA